MWTPPYGMDGMEHGARRENEMNGLATEEEEEKHVAFLAQ